MNLNFIKKGDKVLQPEKRIYVDGSGTGIFGYAEDKKDTPYYQLKPVIFEKEGITNNEAEYLAVIKALESLDKYEKVTILSDSQLVVNQLTHRWKIKEERLADLAQMCWAIMKFNGVYVYYKWVGRNHNKMGRLLERELRRRKNDKS